jgi:hypothetical protein
MAFDWDPIKKRMDAIRNKFIERKIDIVEIVMKKWKTETIQYNCRS